MLAAITQTVWSYRLDLHNVGEEFLGVEVSALTRPLQKVDFTSQGRSAVTLMFRVIAKLHHPASSELMLVVNNFLSSWIF